MAINLASELRETAINNKVDADYERAISLAKEAADKGNRYATLYTGLSSDRPEVLYDYMDASTLQKLREDGLYVAIAGDECRTVNSYDSYGMLAGTSRVYDSYKIILHW